MSDNFEDSSEDENALQFEEERRHNPLTIDWLSLSEFDNRATLAISSLPGCRFRSTWRNLEDDIKTLQEAAIEEVFILCTLGELVKYRVPTLLSAYESAGLIVHHWPILDGTVPAIDDLLHLLQDMQLVWNAGSKALIHCYGGLGRACLGLFLMCYEGKNTYSSWDTNMKKIAICLLLQLDDDIQPEAAIERLRHLRGPSAVQTVKQYNFIVDFRQLRNEYLKDSSVREPPRSLSR